MPVLLIDLGNTALKWTLSGNPDGVVTFVHHGLKRIPDTLQQAWLRSRPVRVVGCSVGSESTTLAATEFFNMHGIPWEWLKAQRSFRCGKFSLVNGYDSVRQLGADRWFAAVGAASLYPGESVLVVHMGTATTVDSIVASGRGSAEYLGGRILPGPALMMDALIAHTGCRPGGTGLPQEFPVNTADAIATGIIEAHLGMIRRALEAMRERGPRPHLIFAGGAAPLLAPYVLREYPEAVLKHNLVLRGLAEQAAAEMTRDSEEER